MKLPEQIVDAHHHWWNPVTNDPDIGYVWLRNIGALKPFGDPTPIQRDYLANEFLGEAEPTRISASVHLQADGVIPDPVAETAFVEALAQTAGHDLAIIGFVDLSSPDAEETIRRHIHASSRFRGVRQILSRLADRPEISFARQDYIEDRAWRDRFSLLRESGLSFDLQCYPEQMHAAAEFLVDFSDVPVIIDHAGSPWDQTRDGIARWRDGLASLAALPQVSIKLAGFGMFDKNWTRQSIQPLFETIEELFGHERMMFGSNFPVDKLMRSYWDILRDMNDLISQWDQKSRYDFFCGNSRRIYRL